MNDSTVAGLSAEVEGLFRQVQEQQAMIDELRESLNDIKDQRDCMLMLLRMQKRRENK